MQPLPRQTAKTLAPRITAANWVGPVPSNFVQPFGDAVLKLSKGQTSEPVQTQYGWHVIKLEDIRDLKVPTFEEMKPNLEKRKQQEEIKTLIEDMRSKAKVE